MSIKFCYAEIVGEWQVPQELKEVPVYELLVSDSFKQAKKAVFEPKGVSSSVTCVKTVPEGLESFKVKSLIASRAWLLFLPEDDRDAKLLYKQAEKFREMDSSAQGVKLNLESLESPEDPNGVLKKEVAGLKQEVATLKENDRLLKEANEALKEANEALKVRVDAQDKTVSSLSETVKVLSEKMRVMEIVEQDSKALYDVAIRKLLDACRLKAKDVLREAGVQIPDRWGDLVENPACVKALMEAGLDENGLEGLRKVPKKQQAQKSTKTLQQRGNDGAHVLVEREQWYAQLVTRLKGNDKKQMMNCYAFYFERDPVDVLFD